MESSNLTGKILVQSNALLKFRRKRWIICIFYGCWAWSRELLMTAGYLLKNVHYARSEILKSLRFLRYPKSFGIHWQVFLQGRKESKFLGVTEPLPKKNGEQGEECLCQWWIQICHQRGLSLLSLRTESISGYKGGSHQDFRSARARGWGLSRPRAVFLLDKGFLVKGHTQNKKDS